LNFISTYVSRDAEAVKARETGAQPDSLFDHELVGLVLDVETGSRHMAQVCDGIFSLYSGRAVSPVTPEELSGRCGLDPEQAGRLAAAVELARRLLWPDDGRHPIRSPQDACRAAAHIRSSAKEHFLAIYLDARNVPVHEETISIGSLNANIVHPREVFKPAIAHSAAAVILVHNHPSGDVSPSQEDLQLTARLVEAGRLIGIEVLDHVIIAERRFLSFRSESYL
jgi:DNA repair protein RadC